MMNSQLVRAGSHDPETPCGDCHTKDWDGISLQSRLQETVPEVEKGSAYGLAHASCQAPSAAHQGERLLPVHPAAPLGRVPRAESDISPSLLALCLAECLPSISAKQRAMSLSDNGLSAWLVIEVWGDHLLCDASMTVRSALF